MRVSHLYGVIRHATLRQTGHPEQVGKLDPSAYLYKPTLIPIHSFTRLSLSALLITDTELKLIAAAAIIGESSKPKNGYSNPAATGTPSMLYTKAKNRFCRILRIVA